MEENKKKAYSEIVEILKLIEDEEKLSKIPFEVIQMFKNNSDPEYKPSISMEIPLEEQNLMNETYSILGFIATKYWGGTLEEEASEIIEEKEDVQEENKLPVLVEDTKWYEKIKNKIIAFLNKIFSKKKNNIEEGV